MTGKKKFGGIFVALIILLLFDCSTQKKKELAEHHYQAGLAYQKADKVDSALIEFRRAIKLDPQHFKAHLSYSQTTRWQKGIDDEIIDEYQEKIRRNPNNALYHYILGTLLVDNPEQMKAEAQKALQINPDYYWGHLLLASAFQREEDHAEAIKAYQAAIAIDSTETSAYSGLAFSYARLDSFDLSNAMYKKVLQLDSTASWVHNSIWRNIILQEGPTPAVKAKIENEIAELLVKNGDNVTNLYYVMWTYRELGEQHKVKEIEDRIIEKDTKGNYAQSIVFNRLYEIESPAEQLKFCEQFLADYPKSQMKGFIYSTICRLLRDKLKLGEEKAIEWGERWIADCPEDAQAYNDIVWYVYQHKPDKLDKALEYATKAVELAKPYQKNYIMDTRGWVLFKTGRYAEAESALVEANKLYEDPDPEVTFHLGAAYSKNGKLDEALKTLALSLALKEDKEVRDYFNQVYREKFGKDEGAEEYLTIINLGEASVAEPYAAPDFTLVSMKGDTVSLSDYKDKVILVAFWKPT